MKGNNQKSSRRAFISATTISGISLMGNSVVGSPTTRKPNTKIQLRSDLKDPLDLKTIEEKRWKAFKRWDTSNGTDSTPISFHTPNEENDGVIVSYNFEMTSEEGSIEHFGYVNTKEEDNKSSAELSTHGSNQSKATRHVEHVHNIADERAKNNLTAGIDSKKDSTIEPLSSDETQFEDDWESLSTANDYIRDTEVGDLNYQYAHKYHPENKEVQAVYSYMDMISGYGSDYHDSSFLNDVGFVEHNWLGRADPNHINDKPNTEYEGSVTTNISVGLNSTGTVSGSVGFTYEQDSVEVNNNSSPVDTNFEWEMVPYSGDAQKERILTSPLSVVHVQDGCRTGRAKDVVQLIMDAQFRDVTNPFDTEYRSLKHSSVHSYVDRTYC